MGVTSGLNAGVIIAESVRMANYFLEQTSSVEIDSIASSSATNPSEPLNAYTSASSSDESDGMPMSVGESHGILVNQTHTTKRMEVNAKGVEVFVSGADNVGDEILWKQMSSSGVKCVQEAIPFPDICSLRDRALLKNVVKKADLKVVDVTR